MAKVDQCHVGAGFPVFEIGERLIDGEAVIRAADFLGAREPCRHELIAGLVADCRAGNRGLVPSVRALQAMSDAFRYDRDLITAEETERWVERRGLSIEDFHEFFLRRYWRARLKDVGPDDEKEAELPGLEDLERLVLAELVMTGEFDRVAEGLCRRMAVAHQAGPGYAPPARAIQEARERFLDRGVLTEPGIPRWLARIGVDEAWLEEMLRIDAAYHCQCDRLLVDEARGRTLKALRLPLTRIEVEAMQLQSEDAAQEAHLCITQDGVPMEELARDGDHPHRRVDLLLGDLDEELSRLFLSAAPGEVLAPMENDGVFQLCRIVGKTEPTLSDEKTRKRIDDKILSSYFDELTARHVRWRLSDEGAE